MRARGLCAVNSLHHSSHQSIPIVAEFCRMAAVSTRLQVSSYQNGCQQDLIPISPLIFSMLLRAFPATLPSSASRRPPSFSLTTRRRPCIRAVRPKMALPDSVPQPEVISIKEERHFPLTVGTFPLSLSPPPGAAAAHSAEVRVGFSVGVCGGRGSECWSI